MDVPFENEVDPSRARERRDHANAAGVSERENGGTLVNLKVDDTKGIIPDPGPFKLEHLHPVKLILFKRFHLFIQPPIITKFFILQREEGEKEKGLKMEKGFSP